MCRCWETTRGAGRQQNLVVHYVDTFGAIGSQLALFRFQAQGLHPQGVLRSGEALVANSIRDDEVGRFRSFHSLATVCTL